MTALGRPELATAPRYTPPIAALAVVRELRDIVDTAFARLTLEEAGELLTKADLIWAPQASLEEVFGDPQAWDAGCFVESVDSWGGAFLAPAAPIRFPGLDAPTPRAAPRIGQHTRQILAEAGYGPEAIEAMLAAGHAVQGEVP